MIVIGVVTSIIAILIFYQCHHNATTNENEMVTNEIEYYTPNISRGESDDEVEEVDGEEVDREGEEVEGEEVVDMEVE